MKAAPTKLFHIWNHIIWTDSITDCLRYRQKNWKSFKEFEIESGETQGQTYYFHVPNDLKPNITKIMPLREYFRIFLLMAR